MDEELDLVTLVERYAAVTSSMDVDAYAALFSTDCVREDPVGQPANLGRGEVRASWQGVIDGAKSVTFTPSDVHVVANRAAYHFEVRVQLEGATVTINGIETFVFNNDGEISEMRAYWSNDDLVVG